MKKVLSVIFAFVFIITMFSACKNDEVNIEDFEWKLTSVTKLDEKELNISAENVILTAGDGELLLWDKTNSETFNGAYEELLVTDNADDYKIFLDGKEGYINVSKTVYEDKTEEPLLIMTIDGYDLYFHAE
ncbi:MAG: hypothetical protein IJZ16_06585 [Clostridia bacterium]|nr:hypothetical protein [Clostridia bacterium]